MCEMNSAPPSKPAVSHSATHRPALQGLHLIDSHMGIAISAQLMQAGFSVRGGWNLSNR